ncbi:hypothetical protein ACFXAW_23935 [Streptomyces sp. NPDC059445]|uniref:hypothetical protein n=1 Tax=Streptomyces sp. NPDC059445 TaxID=3346832 RepID=UPI0036CB5882
MRRVQFARPRALPRRCPDHGHRRQRAELSRHHALPEHVCVRLNHPLAQDTDPGP